MPVCCEHAQSSGQYVLLQGGHDRAIRYHEVALAIRVEALGEKHPDVAATYNNLGTMGAPCPTVDIFCIVKHGRMI
jgi:hypothetical protein